MQLTPHPWWTHLSIWAYLAILCQITSPVLTTLSWKKGEGESGPFHLDPVGIESGAWSEWGARSTCSRPCGLGISSQTRTCLTKAISNGGGGEDANECVGSRSRYFTCNHQPCPDTDTDRQPDFRAQQCSQFDSVPYQGQIHKWTPYKKGNNKCELLCRPENGSFYVSFAPQLIDGTPCNDDGTSVCVRGKCVSIGCDKKLGSHLQEDKCAVCGGDGSKCKFVEGLYDDTHVPESSYAEFLIIPSGSTNIQIRERRPSENYIAMRNVSGEYMLNGDFKVEAGKKVMHIANTTFIYHRKSSMHPPAELLTAKGPTTEPVIIAMLHQESNPGILYEFYAPKNAPDNGPMSFTWLARSYGPCNSSCGGGQQTRQVVCVRTSDYEPVDDERCDAQMKPRPTRQCSLNPCPAFWNVGEWGTCSASCGGGMQMRSLLCLQKIGDLSVVVGNNLCKTSLNKPEISRPCSQIKCPEWTTSEWSSCSSLCGPGFQKRTVVCKSRNGKEAGQALADAACNSEKKPAKSQACLLSPCEGLEWASTDWSGCNSCGQTRKTRRVICTSQDGRVYPTEMCDAAKKPSLSEACKDSPPCDAVWFVTEWSKCSSSCGEGVKSRQVFCGTIDAHNLTNIIRVNADLCDVEKKSSESEKCTEHLSCPGEWFAGPWMGCNAPCGGGTRRRNVMCLKKGAVNDAAECDQDDKPIDNEDCNTEPCDKEGFVLMDSCAGSKFGCCPDGVTSADGINAKGCPLNDATETVCAESQFGCCPDNVTSALGPYASGCNFTAITLRDVCSRYTLESSKEIRSLPDLDNSTSATGNVTDESFPDVTQSSSSTSDVAFDDSANSTLSSADVSNSTEIAADVNSANITDITVGETNANATLADRLDLDSDNITVPVDNATASTSADQILLASEPLVDDNATDTEAPAAADCLRAQWGCCPDNITAAAGVDNLGCDGLIEGSGVECQDSPYGCCQNNVTAAKGPEFKGCELHRLLHTVPEGFDITEGECAQTLFGCCSDRQTVALDANRAGCPENDCSMSEHGCCPDGQTSAKGPQYEQCPHTKPPKQICEQPHDQGTCRNFTVKWYYDTEYGDCNRFWYGGCDGNDNRFDGETECQAECVSPAATGVCNLFKNRGPCDQNVRMWYYDKYFRECLPFHYGGCLGNDNRFETREQCNERCVETQLPDVCQQPTRTGSCEGQVPRWSFERSSGKCNQFLYSGCGGNGNRFGSDEQCLKKCGVDTAISPDICLEEKSEGNCNEFFSRYYFDRDSRTCQQFVYTGCNGNDNRFDSLSDCETNCRRWIHQAQPEYLPPSLVQPEIDTGLSHCFEEPDPGQGDDNLQRWHYDRIDGVCKRFTYGGSEGNRNNYQTQSECDSDCSRAQDQCILPKVVGPCRGAFTVFYYDTSKHRCFEFTYGGCQGNGNRFQSIEECERNCSHVANQPPTEAPVDERTHTWPTESQPAVTSEQNPYLAICSMGVDAGACDERIPRYYYDISQGKCISFTYTGCGGNQNHFLSQEQCEGFCASFGVGCPVPNCDIQCPYGFQNDQGSCPTCRCNEPCRSVQCPAYEVCQVQGGPTGNFVGVCSSRLERAGTCPSLEDIPPGSCTRECSADNECSGLQKCCSNGCGSQCMTPFELVDEPLVTSTLPPFRQPMQSESNEFAAYIVAGPVEIRAELGQRVALLCQARGVPEPQVFWQHNNATVAYGDTHYIQRQYDLVIEKVQAEDAGDYDCIANNGIGPSAELRMHLTIQSSVIIEGKDLSVSVKRGDRAILKCTAHGHPQPRISWSKGGDPIRESEKFRQLYDGSLVIENVSDDDENVFICTADNGHHTPAIKNVVLRVHEEIRTQIIAQTQNFEAGNTIRLDCRASGHPQPRLRWYHNAQEIISDGDRSQVFSNGTLIVKKLRANDAGVYQCQASNEHTHASDSLRVFVTGARLSQDCTDNVYYANCKLIVQAELCSNEYYGKFCCKSCSEAGQLQQGRQQRRRRRKRLVF